MIFYRVFEHEKALFRYFLSGILIISEIFIVSLNPSKILLNLDYNIFLYLETKIGEVKWQRQ